MIVPIWLASNGVGKLEVTIIDESHSFNKVFESNRLIHYDYLETTNDSRKGKKSKENIVIIPNDIHSSQKPIIKLIGYERDKKILEQQITKTISSEVLSRRIGYNGVTVHFSKIEAKSSFGSVQVFIAYGGVVIIYFFVFMYSTHLMKGVMEERSSKVVEVLLSAVKPVHILWGKLIGIGAAGLLQFLFWVFSIWGLSSFVYSYYGLEQFNNDFVVQSLAKDPSQAVFAYEMRDIVKNLGQINLFVFVLVFVTYFIVGYLIYGALFAVIGSISDTDTETQQYSLPVTFPLLLSVLFVSTLLYAPDGNLARILSFIPLTSPVAIIARAPFLTEANNVVSFLSQVVISLSICFVTIWLILKFCANRYKKSLVYKSKKFLW